MEWHKVNNLRWLTGSIRKDLNPSQRSVWADLLCVAGMSRRQGYVERSEGVPYTPEELASLFVVPLVLVTQTVNICCIEGRITVCDDGTLFITNWERWQAIPDSRKRQDKAKADARDNGRRRRAALDRVVTVVNELNARIKDVKYAITADGDILDVKTGEVRSVEEMKASQEENDQ